MSMFKFLFLLLFVLQKAFAKRETLLEYESVVDTTKYTFRYKTNSGVVREEFGEMSNPGTADQNYVVKGRFVNFFPDGSLQIVDYVADKYGYHPKITFLTSQQLQKLDEAKPITKGTSEPEEGIYTDKKTGGAEKPELTTDSVPPADHIVNTNLVRVSPQVKPDVNMIGIRNRTKPPFGHKESSSTSLDDDYDDSINDRIGGGTAAALLGIR